MKPPRAIGILEDPDGYLKLILEDDELDATQLGIEALKAILKARALPNPPAFLWLPSETKD